MAKEATQKELELEDNKETKDPNGEAEIIISDKEDKKSDVKPPENDIEKRLSELQEKLTKETEARKLADEKSERLEKERQEANAKASHAEGRAATTQEEAINNALAASDEALVSHRAAYKAALEAGDSEKAVEAQEKFTEAKYLNSELKKQKVVVERWKKDQEELAKRPKETQLPQSVQAWIARNPKYNSDTDYRDEADAAHDVAIRKGYGFGSPAYIEFIDKRLEKMFPVEKLLSENDTKPEKPISYSAPPNRGSSTEGGSQSERKFKLTAAEVEAAVITGYAEDEHDKKGLLAYAMAKEEGKS